MVTLKAHFDGKVIVPEEPTGLSPGARVLVTLEPIDQGPEKLFGKFEFPLLTGVDPATVRTIIEDAEFDIANSGMESFLTTGGKEQ